MDWTSLCAEQLAFEVEATLHTKLNVAAPVPARIDARYETAPPADDGLIPAFGLICRKLEPAVL